MEVISKINTDDWTTKHNCTTYDTELNINKTDLIYLHTKGGFDGHKDCHYYYVRCPVCVNLSYVPHKDIPKMVAFEIREKAEKITNKETAKSFFARLLSWIDNTI